ncbi:MULTISPECIES: isopenicillin N synthase family dioxygenase [Rhizobium]|uniref:Isopenicillin N synthase-like dioxygenase n=1 Tax=Rhizobium paranaense TaxID=1650438 RepID=A0A7W8XUK3_9HYPH|nr:2-oxoglutarate and iron-dependent oxygenase domain-containing protein [Rhizobium paranaense]MBB5575649.1 isopenicillin N synthase-like dioxygenase [Rhizobium paranaense]
MTTHLQPANEQLALPVIDLSRFHGPADDRDAFVAELRRTLFDHGFFYLIGHGVDPGLVSSVIDLSKRFFALPLEEKLKIEMVKSPHFRGYNRAGQERTRGERDWREQLDVNTEGEPAEIGPDTPAWNRLFGPNQWPTALAELKPVLLAYQKEVTRVGIDILKAIAAALGKPENVFAEIYEPQPSQLLKIIRYPGREVAESDQGVGAHKDGGFVTILLQDTERGLRVRTEEGAWIDVPPVPGTFIINTGELLELATNGFVRADVHDVVGPPVGKERYSVAFFLGSRYDATIPLIELPEELKSVARGVTVDPLNPIFREVGQNHLKSRLRSHPDVALAHHADLLTPEHIASIG